MPKPESDTTNTSWPVSRYMEARDMIDSLPQEQDLSVRDLAIHLRAYQAGVYQGERQAKEAILHKFQLSIIGHVL